MVFLDELLEGDAIFSQNNRIWFQNDFFPHMQDFFCTNIILGSTLCKNDGNNWLKRVHNSFILNTVKGNNSLRERPCSQGTATVQQEYNMCEENDLLFLQKHGFLKRILHCLMLGTCHV